MTRNAPAGAASDKVRATRARRPWHRWRATAAPSRRKAGTKRRLVPWSALLSLVLGANAHAEGVKQPNETLPGFRAQGVYESQGIENLSLFNGDPQLAVPLGPAYPTGSGSSFQLTAHYSSRFWHMYEVPCGAIEYCGTATAGRAHVRGLPTLGVGWTLELGSIDPSPGANVQARYLSPDGGIHEFNEPSVAGPPASIRDGIEVRIERLSPEGYVVRQADGTSLWLTHRYTRPPSRNGVDFSDVDRYPFYPRTERWGLSRILDRFDRTILTVHWDADFPWKVQAIQLRDPSRTIRFRWGTYSVPGQGYSWDVLTSIDFPVFTTPAATLTTVFEYAHDGEFERTKFDSGGDSKCQKLSPRFVSLPFLASITQSENRHEFEYSLQATLANPAIETSTGLLTAFRLPTGTRVEYEYSSHTAAAPCIRDIGCGSLDVEPPLAVQTDEDPEAACDFWARIGRFVDNAAAVVRRTETDPTTGKSATTTYTRDQFSELEPERPRNELWRDPERTLRRVIVKRPTGNGPDLATTRHLFHVTSAGTGLEVERRVYLGPLATSESGSVVRSVVQCHLQTDPNHPSLTYCGAFAADGTISRFALDLSTDSRVSREVTWYGPNPLDGEECSDETATKVACKAVNRSGWNPSAREFAEETLEAPTEGPSSAFFQKGLAGRRTITAWTPSPDAARWRPKLYSSRKVVDLYGGVCPLPCAITTSTDFAPDTGALRSSSVSGEGISRTTSLSYTNGDPTLETISGVGLSGTYETVRTFQSGLVTTSRRTSSSGPGWLQLDVSRDGALGLVTESRDPNGLSTTYAWDAMGRLKSISPPGGEHRTTICYTPWSSATPSRGAWVLVRKGGSESCSSLGADPAEGSETVEAYVYDGSGRLSREIRLQPNMTSNTFLAMRTTQRNAIGLVTAVSEWVSCGNGTDLSTCFQAASPAVNRTTFSSFDPFGRARTIVQPDGTKVFKSYDDWQDGWTIPYSDTREDTITSNVAGGDVFRWTRRDLLGRVIVASEPVPNPPGNLPLTFYHWDIHDGLALVEAARTTAARRSVTQQRRFRRNALGLLVSATDPESGETTWSSFDALGNAWEKTNGGVSVDTQYDHLGRLTRVSSLGREYGRIHYDGTEGGSRTDACRGRVTKRIGFNPGAFANARIEETFTYGGRGGRLSSRRQVFVRGGGASLANLLQTFTWNEMGLPASRTLSGPGATFSTDTRYRAGLETRILSGTTTLLSSATYHPHGGLSSYTTGNGVKTSLEADPNGLPRPARIRTSGAAATFDTGAFTYDGAGNVTSMGSIEDGTADVFTYDRLSRLKTAQWRSLSTTYAEAFSYDDQGEMGFGNLTRIQAQGPSMPALVDLPADPSTNRLALGTYDPRGNLTAYPAGAPVPELAFAYDALSRRTSESRQGALVSWNLYDAGNERVARVLPGPTPSGRALGFYTLSQCRLLDTRTDGAPALTGGQPREIAAVGRCGIPAAAVSFAGNLTVVPRASTRSNGFLKLYPADVPPPTAVAGVVNPAKVRAQLTFGKLSASGAFRLLAELPHDQSVDAIVDVAGYFAPPDGARRWELTQRDAGNRPVADWTWDEGRPSAVASAFHVYLGATKVATRELLPSAAWTFFSSDHLGTPRLKTGEKAQGQPLAPVRETYRYRAFGQKFEALGQADRSGREFAMMERDAILPPGATAVSGEGTHYVHARYFADRFARFLSPDQLMGSPEDPQSWNRYAYARNNPLKYVDPDGKEIQYSAAYVSRIRSDSAFAAAHRAWRFSPSGSEQHRRMGGDPNTRYVLTVGPVTYFGSSGTNFGVTYPVPEWAKTNKAGKLDAPKVEMTIDVDARRATDPQPPGTSTAAELAKTIFHESSHGLDTGSGTRTAAETRQRETALTNESDPAMVKFKLELKTTLPSDEKELKK